MPLISVESTTIQLRVNLSATATELKATPFFPLILLQMMVEADPHLISSIATAAPGGFFLLLKFRKLHTEYTTYIFNLAWSEFTEDRFLLSFSI